MKWACVDRRTSITWDGLVGHGDEDIVRVFQVGVRYWFHFATDADPSSASILTLGGVPRSRIVRGDGIAPIGKETTT